METRASTSVGSDHVIGGFRREVLSAALASTHRAGFGAQTRVIDGARGEIGQQVERLGLVVPWEEPPGVDTVLIVVNAPGRAVLVATLFSEIGADFVVHAEHRTATLRGADAMVSLTPDIRIGEGAGAGSDA